MVTRWTALVTNVLIDDMYTTLDVPGCSSSVVAGAMAWTTPRKINDAGQIVAVLRDRGKHQQRISRDRTVKP